MLDVGAVSEELWRQALAPAMRGYLSKHLQVEEDEARKWVVLLAALHDIGKAWPLFQFRHAPARKALTASGFSSQLLPSRTPHAEISALVVEEVLQREDLGLIALDRQSALVVAHVLGGHHGIFPSAHSLQHARDALSAAEGRWPWSQLRSAVVRAVIGAIDKPRQPLHLSFEDNAAAATLTGLVTTADWIGSSEEAFQFIPWSADTEAYWKVARERACRALAALGWGAWRPPNEVLGFEGLFPGLAPRPVQKLAEALAREEIPPRLIIIEVPTGEGKTEAALALQDAWCTRLGQRGCYLALPTMATSNQMFERAREFLSGRYPQFRTNLHLLHGHAWMQEDYQQLKARAIAEEAEADESLVADEWFTKPKRGFLAPFAVGTVDQALLSVELVKHGYLRQFGLANKTLIFDEVHAYDTFMVTIFERLMEWLAALDTTVVILSATLPSERRRALLQAYSGQTQNLPDAPYPRVTWVDADGSVHAETVEVTPVKPIQLEWKERGVHALANDLPEQLGSTGCAAWICNTVRAAQKTYEELQQALAGTSIDVRLFHARFPMGQRNEIETDALKRYGKSRQLTKPSILVATQVIEQSLDLDFDLMISELAPVDLVIQRAGRLQRHVRTRRDALQDRRLILLQPSLLEDDTPSLGNSVYDEWLLLRTWLVLKDRAAIASPADIEPLVESVYGEVGDTEQSAAMSQRLEAASKKTQLALKEQRRKARKYLIRKPADEEFLEQWNPCLEEDSPDAHPTLRAQTRDTGPTVTIACLHAVGDNTCLDRAGGTCIDLGCPPDVTLLRGIMESTVTLSYKGCGRDFPEESIPKGWRKSSALRHCRAVIFTDDTYSVSRLTLRLDPELGLVLAWAETEGE